KNSPRACYDLEQKLSALKLEKAALESKIEAAKAKLYTSAKVEGVHELSEYKPQLEQVEKNIETTQAALDQCPEVAQPPVPDLKRYPLGTFVNDWVYTKGTGNTALDECNGKECYSPDLGKLTYCYFITEEFPYIPRFFRGTPHEK